VLDCDTDNLPGRIVAVNEAGLSLRLDADVMYFSDRRFYDWNNDRLDLFKGRWIVTTQAITRGHEKMRTVKKAAPIRRREPFPPLSNDPRRLAGWCSGGRAINLAYLLGASEIVLIGFDMHEKRGANYHNMHKGMHVEGRKEAKFMPAIEAMASGLADAGVKVINATPGSALTCFPIMSLEDYHASATV
jgi:hypothetical protein